MAQSEREKKFFELFFKYMTRKEDRKRLLLRSKVQEVEIREPEEKAETTQEALDKLVGLAGVKQEIKKLTNMATLQKRRKEAGRKIATSSMHLVFTGSPGTGKTTVARLVGRIFKDIGLLSKGHMIETDRSKLVGEYVGHTEHKVKATIEKAMGGVLFIDEAYALAGERNDFGKVAIDTLIKLMEDNRDNLAVIVAGYTEPMKHFVSSNVGLQSRFTRYITFEDYSDEELFAIYKQMIEGCQYKLDTGAVSKAKNVLYEHWLTRDEHFGNGRDVRTFFERTVENQASRIVGNQDFADLDTIFDTDVPSDLIINIAEQH